MASMVSTLASLLACMKHCVAKASLSNLLTAKLYNGFNQSRMAYIRPYHATGY